GGTAGTEAAVLPGDIDVAAAVDLRARQRARPQIAGHTVEADGRDRHGLRPRGAAVVREERGDLPVQALEGHDDRAVRLDERLAAEPLVAAGGLDRRAPGLPAVGGRAHQLAVAVAEVVELRVAVSAEGDARVVADGPVL